MSGRASKARQGKTLWVQGVKKGCAKGGNMGKGNRKSTIEAKFRGRGSQEKGKGGITI